MRHSEYIPVRASAARNPRRVQFFHCAQACRIAADCRAVVVAAAHLPRVAFALLILSGRSAARAQQAEKDPPPGVGNLDRAEVNGDTLTLHAGADTIVVQVVEPNILRVHYQPQGQTSPPTPVLDPNRTFGATTLRQKLTAIRIR